MSFDLPQQSCSVVVPIRNRSMVSLPLMLDMWLRALLGTALLSATATVYAAGDPWIDDLVTCSPDPSFRKNYVGVCGTWSTDASDATVEFDGAEGSAENVYGGYSDSGNATGNTVTVSGGTVESSVYGGRSFSGDATGNAVTVSGGTVKSDVYGGSSSSGDATGNTVTVSEGTVAYRVYGGYSDSGSATNNRVILAGSPDLSSAEIYGGAGRTVTGNVLEVRTKDVNIRNVWNFNQYAFLLPADTKAGDTVLTLTGVTTDLTTAKVGVAMQSGGDLLKKGDKVALIHNENGVKSTDVKQISLTGYKGISLEYTFGLASDANNLYAVTESAP